MPKPSGMMGFSRPDGSKGLADAETIAFLRNQARPAPSDADIQQLFAQTTRVTIQPALQGSTEPRAELCAAEEIRQLASVLSVRSTEAHVMSPPSFLMDLYAGDKCIASLHLVSYGVLRSDRWRCDAGLTNVGGLVTLLDAFGIHKHLKDFERDRDILKSEEVALRRWRNAAPASLRALVGQFAKDSGDPFTADLSPLQAALAAEVPSPVDRAAAIINWIGKGGVLWSGYLMDELFAYRLLAEYDIETLAAAIATPTAATSAGMVRYLHWRRENDHAWPKRLPAATRAALHDQMRSHTDREARDWARDVLE
jgi:hypothetical protein